MYSFFRPSFLHALSLACALLLSMAIGAQARYQPVKFGGKKQILFSPSAPLDLGEEGTIEFLFRADNTGAKNTKTQTKAPTKATQTGLLKRILGPKKLRLDQVGTSKKRALVDTDTLGAQTLITHATSSGTQFTVYLNRSATRIGLYNGTEFKSVVFNFNDAKFHHVALATANGRTAVIIDGTVRDTLDVSYGASVDAPVVLGSARDYSLPFKGKIQTVRVWREALDVDDLSQLQVYGQPALTHDKYPSLIFYSEFSEIRESIYFAHPPLFRSDLLGVRGDTTIRDMLGPGEYYSEIAFQYFSGCTGKLNLYKSKAGQATDTVRFASVGDTLNFPDGGSITFKENEYLTGVTCMNNGGCLKSIRFISNLGAHPIGGVVVAPEAESEMAVARLPEGALLEGFEIELTSDTANVAFICGFRLLYSMEGNIDVLGAGNWAVDDQAAPVRDDDLARRLGHINESDGGVNLHGNYTSTPVIKMEFEPTTDSLVLLIDLPARAITPDSFVYAEVSSPYKFGPSSTGRRFWWKDGKVRITFLEENSFELYVDPATEFPLTSNIYTYQGQYDKRGKDKNEWGGTFTLNQRPTLLDFNFRGYNAARINPFNYQISSGTDKFVFAMPTEDSYDYYFSNSDKIVPYGLYFANDRESISRAHSTTVSSEKDHQSSWEVNLGMNLGVAGMALSQSGAFQHATEKMRSTKMLHTTSSSHEVKYALVLDRARMKLDPEFRAAILRMRDELLVVGDTVTLDESLLYPNYMHFIETYGTHYPYAVTYGGMAYQNIALSETAVSESVSNGANFSRKASATLEGVTLGTEVGGGFSQSDGNTSSDINETKVAYTVGGEVSYSEAGAGWNLPNGDEVPVLLDLRMISELLSPLYFDDPFVWGELRTGLEKALYTYDTSHHISTNPWMEIPNLQKIEIEIVSFDNAESGDLDGSGEWVSHLQVQHTDNKTDTARLVTFNTTADGLDDDTSLPLHQTIEFWQVVSEGGSVSVNIIGDVTDLDSVGDDDVMIPDTAGATITLTAGEPLSQEWTNGSVALSDGSTFNEASGTITYRYRMILANPRVDPPKAEEAPEPE